MSVTITGLDRELAAVLDEVSATLGKSRPQIANNIGSQIAQKASSGRTRFTKAVSAAELRADLNTPIGDFQGRVLRRKHGLAIKSLKAARRELTWGAIQDEAKRIVRIKSASRAFLRAGWLWPAFTLGVAARKFRANGNRNERGFRRGGAGGFGPRAAKGRRFSAAKPATEGNPTAVIENLAVDLTASRTVPDYGAAVFDRGSPSRMKAIGEVGLQKAGAAQIAFERRTLPRALESQVRRAAQRGERRAQSLRGLGRSLL